MIHSTITTVMILGLFSCTETEPDPTINGPKEVVSAPSVLNQQKSTAVIANYNEGKVQDPEVVAVRDKVSVHTDDSMGLAHADVSVTLKDGTVHSTRGDVEAPERDLDRQWSRLSAKFTDMAAPVIGSARVTRAIEAVRTLEDCGDIGEIAQICGAPSHDA